MKTTKEYGDKQIKKRLTSYCQAPHNIEINVTEIPGEIYVFYDLMHHGTALYNKKTKSLTLTDAFGYSRVIRDIKLKNG